LDIKAVLSVTREQSDKCFLCRLISEDLDKNGKLTGYPLDWGGSGTFPVEGKIRHLKLEGLTGQSISQ
jgi:hypothetical protein